MRVPGLALPRSLWVAGIALGAVAGGAAVLPPLYLAAGLVAVGAGIWFVRGPVRGEAVVAAYWIAFCVFSTVLAGDAVGGLFYPFYAALALGAVLPLVVGGLRVPPAVAWPYVALLFVLVASLIGFTGSMGSETLELLILFPFGALVMLQVRSPRGVRTIAAAAVIASLIVSVWVIVSATQGDFAYRGAVEVNENVASFYVGLGLIVALAAVVHPSGRRRETILAVLAMGTMTYTLVLLASRGMIIGLVLAVAALFVRTLILDRRRVAVFVVLAASAAGALLLPGGAGTLERFADPSTATGGGRTQIWAAVGRDLAAAGPVEMLFGHGFGSSRELVRQTLVTVSSTHSAYLQVLYELGAVGFALFLGLHLWAIVRSWSVPGREGAWMLGLVVFLLGADLFMSTVDDFLYWTALGFALGIGVVRRRVGA